MLPKLLLPAVISAILLTTNVITIAITTTTSTSTASTTTTRTAATPAATTTTTTRETSITTDADVRNGAAATTTPTSSLPLQPPINVTSTTTSSFIVSLRQRQRQREQQQQQRQQRQSKHSISDNVTVRSDSLLSGSNSSSNNNNNNIETKRNNFRNIGQNSGAYEGPSTEAVSPPQVQFTTNSHGYYPTVRQESSTNDNFVPGPLVFRQNSVPEESTETLRVPTNSQGYIKFELNYDDADEQAKIDTQRSARTETVNEVLSNLFPNGFADIFRFSYGSEHSTTERPVTTAKTPIYRPTSTTAAPTTVKSLPKNQTSYSYVTTVSKEYRREVRPGHTEIVIEQMAKTPRSSSEEFKDGSNLISKDELLRINRAAVDASVLPSLLVEPSNKNETIIQNATISNAPIIILNEDSSDLEQNDEEDNQIAESQYVAQHVYQRLPEAAQGSYPYKDAAGFKSARGGEAFNQHEQQINVQIIQDDTLKAIQNDRVPTKLFTPADELPLEEASQSEQDRGSQELDRFQEHAEQNFHQRNLFHEAPSRKFLKSFNPQLSEGIGTPAQKGNFHYETSTRSSLATPIAEPAKYGNYRDQYAPPAVELQYPQDVQHQIEDQRKQQQEQEQQKQRQQLQDQQQKLYKQQQQFQQQQQQERQQQQHYQQQQQHLIEHSTHIRHSTPTPEPRADANNNYDSYPSAADDAPITVTTPKSFLYVTLSTPSSQPSHSPAPSPVSQSATSAKSSSNFDKTPHEYVSEAVAAASQTLAQRAAPQPQPQLEPNPKPQHNLGYTFVEVQKSLNIHNKLITEKDGKLVEQHETIYHQPQYAQVQHSQPQQQLPQQQQQQQYQHEHQQLPQQQQQERQHYQPTQVNLTPQDYSSLTTNPIHVQHIDYDNERQEEEASHAAVQQIPAPAEVPAVAEVASQPEVNYVQASLQVEEQKEAGLLPEQPHQYPTELTHYNVEAVPQQETESYHTKEIVEKIVERPVQVPYPVHVERYIDRPYPVHEIVETHVAVPYAVPEPVPVAVPVQHYIDRPYPVETIVEKRVPYPVETVVEKVVEKHVPVEVEKIVERPVEKLVEKFVDRPVPVPIHVPVAVPVPISHAHDYQYYSFPYSNHPNALAWPRHVPQQIPQKVLQNYYTRMLKKILPQMHNYKTSSTVSGSTKTIKPTATTSVAPKTPATIKPTYKLGDILFDLKPPPPPLGPNWAKGARYVYNTLPADLTASAAVTTPQKLLLHGGYIPAPNEPYDEFQRWRNGHSLKRSPDFGRNLHLEYGFKPPLVPSIEIDDQGIPISSAIAKATE